MRCQNLNLKREAETRYKKGQPKLPSSGVLKSRGNQYLLSLDVQNFL
jgi:hypothetical protein